ncbi:MAG: hypothetical protein ACK55Z_25850 [bacterium]
MVRVLQPGRRPPDNSGGQVLTRRFAHRHLHAGRRHIVIHACLPGR